MFSGIIKANIDLKWVKQLQYWRERNKSILLVRNASSSIVKQNYCKNRTTSLTQTTFSKYFSLFTFKTLNNFLKDYFFVQNLFYIKRFSNEIVFKFSRNVELKIVNDPKIG